MPGISSGMEIAKRAMLAHQAALNVFGHNVANVNTPGYTRQRAIVATSYPLDVMPGALGTGVDLIEIRRQRNQFADRQFRLENGLKGSLDARSSALAHLEGLFAEPSDGSVSVLIDRFFNAFSDLSNNPNDRGTKVAVQSAGRDLARGIQTLDRRLADYRTGLNDEINLNLAEANRLAQTIASLNGEIATRTNTGVNPNDLADRRDLLVDELSALVGATAIPQPDGSVSLRIGGTAIVDGTHATGLQLAARGANDPVGAPVLYSNGSPALIESGTIGALVELRDTTTQTLRDQLDTLAAALITKVNGLHSQGTNGVDFFSGTGAKDIGLSTAVGTDAQAINASRSGNTGDNDLALELAGLKDTATVSGTATLGSYFRGVVTGLGSAKKSAADGAAQQELAVQLVGSQRDQANGVNLDEEMTNMLQYQRAYEAAARVFSTMDSLLDTVLTQIGR